MNKCTSIIFLPGEEAILNAQIVIIYSKIFCRNKETLPSNFFNFFSNIVSSGSQTLRPIAIDSSEC